MSKLITKISEQRHVLAVRQGLLLCSPIIILGSFASVVNNLPLDWYQDLMTYFMGANWRDIGQAIRNGSVGIISILLVFSISGSLANNHYLVKEGKLHSIVVSLVSLSCLFIIMQPHDFNKVQGIPFSSLGTGGVFLAVVISLAATEVFLWLCSFKRLTIWVFCDEADPTIPQALTCIVPIMLTMSLFAFAKVGMSYLHVTDIHQYLVSLMSQIFLHMDNTLRTAVVYVVLVQMLWFFGIHGSNVLDTVMRNFYGPALDNNTIAAISGGQTVAFTDAFFNSFVMIGGSGSSLCIVIGLLLLIKRGNITRLAQLSLLPAIFNVNELLLFGLPVILNPFYIIPFVAVPVILTVVSYLATQIGLVPITMKSVAWTTPPILSGYLATGSWKGSALQAFNIVLGTVLFWPFIRLSEKQKDLEAVNAFNKIKSEMNTPAFSDQLLARQDTIGNLARILAHDLRTALNNNEFFLEFQPQINSYNKVIGVEALLRWNHKVYGRIAPPLIIAVAEESGLIQDVGMWVFTKACSQLKDWNEAGNTGLRMSINVSATQLYCDGIAENMNKIIRENGLIPEEIEIEITESIALNSDAVINSTLKELNHIGVRIAIDDFGMGHSSLIYIKNYPINTLKIDRSLINDVVSDRSCQGIIKSINSLCSTLNIDVVAEYVETKEQQEILQQLGCLQYQGYLYSPALSPNTVVEFIQGSPIK